MRSRMRAAVRLPLFFLMSLRMSFVTKNSVRYTNKAVYTLPQPYRLPICKPASTGFQMEHSLKPVMRQAQAAAVRPHLVLNRSGMKRNQGAQYEITNDGHPLRHQKQHKCKRAPHDQGIDR
jgi:hypothetical protein